MFNRLKFLYEEGKLSILQLNWYVYKNIITIEQFQEIVESTTATEK